MEMKLQSEELKQLRDSIKQKLENAEFEGRVKIDKDVLEQLLFDSYIVDVYDNPGDKTKTSKPIKIPAWSGEFLQKIDLSEVDFADVYWGFPNNHNFRNYVSGYEKLSRDEVIDYNNTNANIDLNKAFSLRLRYLDDEKNEYVTRDYTEIAYCNFENVDLSKNSFAEKAISCLNVNFNNTNIKVNKEEFRSVELCEMDNVDLSNFTADLLSMMAVFLDEPNTAFCSNSCMNTGLRIICNKESLDHYDYLFDTDYKTEFFWEQFRGFFDDYNFVGCYFNGTLIESKEQLLELSTNTMKKLIDDYKKDSTQYKMNQLLNSIDEQIEGKKKQDLGDMLNDKVEMIESSIDEQIKSKQ